MSRGAQRISQQIEDRVRAERRARRDAAAVAWGEDNPTVRQRTAMRIAAFLLDEAHEHDLADWLLCAKPEHARTVATGVAVHALRRGTPAAWDALAAVDAIDIRQADDWYFAESDFMWGPKPEWLFGDG